MQNVQSELDEFSQYLTGSDTTLEATLANEVMSRTTKPDSCTAVPRSPSTFHCSTLLCPVTTRCTGLIMSDCRHEEGGGGGTVTQPDVRVCCELVLNCCRITVPRRSGGKNSRS